MIPLLLIIPAFAQIELPASIQSQVKTIQQKLKSEKSDTAQMRLLLAWDDLIYDYDPVTDENLNRQILHIYEKSDNNTSGSQVIIMKKYAARAFNNLGIIYKIQGKKALSVEYLRKAINLNIETGDSVRIAQNLNNLGTTFLANDELDSALYLFSNALKIYEQLGMYERLGLIYENMGMILQKTTNYPLAYKYYLQALKTAEASGDFLRSGKVKFHLSLILIEQGDSARGVSEAYLALKIIEKFGSPDDKASAYTSCGNFLPKSEIKEIIKLLKKASNIYRELNDQMNRSTAMSNLAIFYKRTNQLDSALITIDSAINILEEKFNEKGFIHSYYVKSQIFLAMNRHVDALFWADKAWKTAQELKDNYTYFNLTNLLAIIYSKMGNYKLAYEFSVLENQYGDSVRSEKIRNDLISQQFKFQIKQQAETDSIKAIQMKKVSDAEIARQDAEISKRKTQQYILIISLLFVVFVTFYTAYRFRITRKQKRIIESQKQEVEIQKHEAEIQKELVAEKNKEIIDSIQYAKRLQEAILPGEAEMQKTLADYFMLYKPKDIVAGDFYWLESIQQENDSVILFAVADCTGHGVPGAMVSVICSNALSKTVLEDKILHPDEILNRSRQIISQRLQRSGGNLRDGMDISLIRLVTTQNSAEIEFAGAYNPLIVIRKNGTLEEFKGDKQSVGYTENPLPFSLKKTTLEPGDLLYLLSDGFADQFGGPKHKKLKNKNLYEFLIKIHTSPLHQQRKHLLEFFLDWQGSLEQVDDVCIAGIRI